MRTVQLPGNLRGNRCRRNAGSTKADCVRRCNRDFAARPDVLSVGRLSIVAIVVLALAVRTATILATRCAILARAELTGAALAVDATLHRSILSAIDSAIGQAADEVSTAITHSAAANETRGLEVHNAIGAGAGHQLIQIGSLTGDHALIAAGKRARTAAGGHAAHTALAEGTTGRAGTHTAEAAGTGASADAAGSGTSADAAGHARSAPAEASAAATAVLGVGNFDRS